MKLLIFLYWFGVLSFFAMGIAVFILAWLNPENRPDLILYAVSITGGAIFLLLLKKIIKWFLGDR